MKEQILAVQRMQDYGWMTAIPVFSWNLVVIVGTSSSKRSNRNKDVKGGAERCTALDTFYIWFFLKSIDK